MKYLLMTLVCVTYLFPCVGAIENSVLPSMDVIYSQNFGKKVNHKQRKAMLLAAQNQDQKLRIMTYNMLYNAPDAEEKLPVKYRWEARKPRLLEYLVFAKADVIGSQELQEDQLSEVSEALKDTYGFYGEKTRQNEGRSDVNAIFFNKDRLALVDAKTVPYESDKYENAFTCCRFKDKNSEQTFTVVNTKLTWGDADRRLEEATQLNEFISDLPTHEPLVVLGDFNLFPFILHTRNLFFDGESVLQELMGDILKDAKQTSIFGHFGALCSVTNSKDTLAPFVGPQLITFVPDRILVDRHVDVFTHCIDPATSDKEFPSDHLPVVADVFFH